MLRKTSSFTLNLTLTLFLTLTLALVSCGSENTQQQEKSEKEKAYKVANITMQDLTHRDTLPVGETRSWEYTVSNDGWEDVLLKDATAEHPACACEVPSDSIPIGEDAIVKVTCTFESAGPKGINIWLKHSTPQRPLMMTLFCEVTEE